MSGSLQRTTRVYPYANSVIMNATNNMKNSAQGWCFCRMQATAKFQLDVDVPFPLNVTPKPAIELTGTTAVQRTLENLMDTLCSSIVRDQVAWTKENREASNARVSEKATVTVA